MATRTPSEKKLVDTIVDAEVNAKQLAEKAKGFGVSLGTRLTEITRAIVAARVSGRITAQQAQLQFREAYIALTLVGFVEVAQEVVDHSTQVAADIHTHARALGADAAKTAPIRKADFLARAIEKANGT